MVAPQQASRAMRPEMGTMKWFLADIEAVAPNLPNFQ